ncbi:uncharacterized protein LOC115750365 [Rhodamnia argentea]|uniref:Uncharacterized protein LOC115750365 n=1 Tax=Rhodamnia argentea TaxID=178133 RepID=A0A8B8QAH5_9MYRT|nr:uncharacterized protein LOC115750365 [Rhodamnia argentea]
MHHAYITPSQTHHHHHGHLPAAPKSPSAPPPPPSSTFTVICVLHSLLALFCGSLMMFHAQAFYSLGHGTDAADRLLGSTPQDRLLIRTSDSFAGLLLLAIGLLLLMVSNIKDREFQDFFAKGCTVLHVIVAVWRVSFERRVEDLAGDCLRQTVGDFLLALSWVLFVVYSWREKYD